MLKEKISKTLLSMVMIISLILPYATPVFAAALTSDAQTAELQVLRIHEGGEEASGTLNQEQQKYYDESQYEYRVGDTRVYKIIVKGDTNYENAFYCLDATKSFPGVTSSGYEIESYTNVADLKDSSDTNVKQLNLSTSYSDNSTLWTANYKALIWLVNNMYLEKQAPSQKDDYLSKAFAGYTEYDMDTIKALLTDDDIDVVQQNAIWYFTNRDTEKFDVTTLPAVQLTKHSTEGSKEGAYGDFTPSNFPEGLSYSIRQELANQLYKYLIESAAEAKDEENVTYPVILEDSSAPETARKDGYTAVGPFKVKSGTAPTSKYSLKLLDQDNKEIARENYKILINGESDFTDKNLNEIFDSFYYIYLPESNTATKVKLALSYSSYETQATLWKNNKTNSEGKEIYQPLTLITRGNTPHSQVKEYDVKRETADLALRKYIVKTINSNGKESTYENRKPVVDCSKLKDGTSTTATYKHAKNPIEVSAGDTIVYELRVYNESSIPGTATTIYDALPTGLELVENSTINSTYGWEKVGAGENKVLYKTNYLANQTIEGFNKDTDDTLHSAYVQIECKVSKDASTISSILTNIAEIAEDNISDRDSEPGNNTYVTKDIDQSNYSGDKNNPSDLSKSDYYYQGVEDDDDFEKVIVNGKAFDLNLKKFVSKVNKNAPSPSREPVVDISKLKDGTSTNATYTSPADKTPLKVSQGDIILYTLRVYNEGDLDGYAESVSDYLPEGLGYLVNYTTNIDNYWALPTDDSNMKTVKLSTITNGTKNLSVDDFKGITNLENVDVVLGKVKLTSTKLASSSADNKNLIKAFDKENGTKLDYKDIQIACIVVADKVSGNNLKNIAEIVNDSDENKNPITDRDSTPDSVNPDNYPGDDSKQDDNDYEDLVIENTPEEPKSFDLSLQKFITSVNSTEVKDRYPTITKNTDGSLRFNHSTEPVAVCYNDTVTFTIRVYNEGDIAGYAKEVIDYLPTSGLEFIQDNETNKKYGWTLYDSNGNETNKVSQAVTARTKYLSKSESEKRKEDCLIKAFDKTKDVSSTNPDYRDLQIVFKVTGKVTTETKNSTSSREYKNVAEIYDDEDENGNPVNDKDSTPNNKKDGEDDIDQDKVYVKYFDLSLQKDLVKIIVTEDGTTREINVTDPNTLQKVEIHRKKINTTVVKFVYNITVTNEGEIEGYATEIKDYIPDGLKFNQEENKDWTKVSDNIITTNALASKLLKPGEKASVQVVLQWINGESNFGMKTNVAEISADKNDSGTPDIDSTPNNKKEGEDDIDDASVMLQISTGVATPKYLALTGSVLVIWTVGIVLIKKYVL